MGLFRDELGLVCCDLVTSGRGIVAGKSFEELYQYYRSAFPAVTKEVCVCVSKKRG